MHQLIIDFKKAQNLVRKVIMCNFSIYVCIHMKPVRLIKMCRCEICSRIRLGKILSDKLSFKNGLKQEDGLLPLLFSFALEYSIRHVQAQLNGLKLNVTHRLWFMLILYILGRNVHIVMRKTVAVLSDIKVSELEINAYNSKYIIMYHD